MNQAAALAGRVVKACRTRDIYEITRQKGLAIVFQRWAPVTAGEFDHRTKTIYVNGNAKIPVDRIVAHELGHYFIRELAIEVEGDEELFCDRFADAILP